MNLRSLLLCALLGASAGCAATRAASIEGRSGFLGNSYSLLKTGDDNQAQAVYYNPRANFAMYSKIWLAPVSVIRSKGSNLAGYSREEVQSIASTTYDSFAKELSTRWQIVDRAGPGTLKVELAITEVDRSEPVMDTITSIIPQARTVSLLKTLATGKPAFVGEASGEAKMTDALTGELVAAGMDRRVGTKNFSGMTDSWNDFTAAVDYWAKRFSYNLCVKQSGKDCEAPSA